MIPYVLQIAGKWVSGVLSDAMISRWGVSVPRTRKIMTIFSTWLPGACLFLVPSTTSAVVATALFSTGMFCQGFQISGIDLVASDLFEGNVGFAFGVMNGLGSLAGAVAPLVVGQLTSRAGCVEKAGGGASSHQCAEAWAAVFYISAGVFMFGGLQFAIFGGMDPVYRRAAGAAGRENPRDADASKMLLVQ